MAFSPKLQSITISGSRSRCLMQHHLPIEHHSEFHILVFTDSQGKGNQIVDLDFHIFFSIKLHLQHFQFCRFGRSLGIL
jgi:hypothetical protein